MLQGGALFIESMAHVRVSSLNECSFTLFLGGQQMNIHNKLKLSAMSIYATQNKSQYLITCTREEKTCSRYESIISRKNYFISCYILNGNPLHTSSTL